MKIFFSPFVILLCHVTSLLTVEKERDRSKIYESRSDQFGEILCLSSSSSYDMYQVESLNHLSQKLIVYHLIFSLCSSI